MCLKCGKRQRQPQKRGLCRACYNDTDVRARYPSTSKFAPKHADHYGGYDLPPEPTTALPGTPEKQVVLMERASLGCSLWHPLDGSEPVQRSISEELGRLAEKRT